ncbi:MAG: DUF2252 domain-containing protein [Actinomycetia bacterium]|nr:DUF2252 domain-containing protein [Actinomycetes bacterium]
MNSIDELTGTHKPTPAERAELGKSLREQAPRSAQADWTPSAERDDPVAIIEGQNRDRVQELIPIRRRRMLASPFAFYRATAGVMAGDLSATTSTGLYAQLSGDAHVSNFGMFASPERNLVFDLNDFDETLPGPWEWDLKRLAASVTIAAQDRGFPAEAAQRATIAAGLGYQEAMADFASRPVLENWYAHLSVADIAQLATKKRRKSITKASDKARSRTSQQALKKYATEIDGKLRIRSQPPLVRPLRDLTAISPEEIRSGLTSSLASYRSSLTPDIAHLLAEYSLADVALKVVGVGSVGTLCLISLWFGRDNDDPLFLQVKQANASALAEYLPPSPFDQPGERVVQGQRMIQAVSDIFLGWSEPAVAKRAYYWRQFRDWKGSVRLDKIGPTELGSYAKVCGWTLAHAHARSSDPIAISAYLGSGSVYPRSLAAFGAAYAEQNALDYQEYQSAVKTDHLEVAPVESA